MGYPMLSIHDDVDLWARSMLCFKDLFLQRPSSWWLTENRVEHIVACVKSNSIKGFTLAGFTATCSLKLYIHTYIHTLHYITLPCIALHCVTLHCIALHCIALHYITYIHTLHTYIHTYIQTYIHTYILCIYIYINIYISI